MSETSLSEPQSTLQGATSVAGGARKAAPCEECVGSGGWYRYEPSMEDSPGRLYLSCLGCRGSGRTALAAA
ncbi:MAG: hypothetical protein JWP22_1944 [Ramlibacter sp.]|nr:hypothetical protein [Ramlibacter sp.]